MAIGLHFEIPYHVPYISSDARLDPLHWMRENKEEFRKCVQKTNDVTQKYLSSLNTLKEKLIAEMESKVDLDFPSKTKRVGNYLYYTKYENKDNYPTYFRQNLATSKTEKLYNWDSQTVLNYIPSPCGKYVLFVIDDKGTQFGDIFVYDCSNHTIHHKEIIANNNGNIVWKKNGEGFWYASANLLKRTDQVLYHKINTPSEEDNVVYQELDIRFEVEVLEDSLNAYILSSSINSSDLSIIRSNKLETIVPRSENVVVTLIPS